MISQRDIIVALLLFCCFVVLRSKTKGVKQKNSNKSIQTKEYKSWFDLPSNLFYVFVRDPTIIVLCTIMVRSFGSNNYCALHNHGSILWIQQLYPFIPFLRFCQISWFSSGKQLSPFIPFLRFCQRSNNYLPLGDHGSISLLTWYLFP